MDKEKEEKVDLEEQEKELQEEIEKFKKLEEETDEMIEDGKVEESSDEEEQEETESSEEDEETEEKDSEDESKDEEKEESKSETSEEEMDEKFESLEKQNNIRTIVIIALIIIILLLIFFIVFKKYREDHKNNNNQVTIDDLNEHNREIMNVDNKKEDSKQQEVKKEIIEKNTSKNKQNYDKLKDKDKKDVKVVPSTNDVPIEKLDNMDDLYDEKTNLPKKYNLKDELKLKLEDQSDYGLCWAFASNNSIETNYMLNNKKDLDLSEIYDDYMTSDYLFDSYRRPHDGGAFYYISSLSDAFGLAIEEKDEYKDYMFEESFDFLDRKRNIYITHSTRFPSIYKTNGEVDDYSDDDAEKVREKVKRHIMEYGSVYAVVVGTMDKNNYFSSYEDGFPNHAISIVGWDDTYSKNNFKSPNGSQPVHDGAYIVLNSYGETSGDKGYQYYSYDDAFIETDMTGVLKVSDNIDNFYKLSDYSETVQKVIKDNFGHNVFKKDGEYFVSPNVFDDNTGLHINNSNLTNNDLKQIVDLFPDLLYLDLENNKISDVSVLNKLYGLYHLDLTNNNVSDVSSLSELENLDTLILDNNKGVKGYSKLNGLEYLSINDCDLNETEDLSKLNNLWALSANDNNLKMVEGISFQSNGNSTVYGVLELNNNNISDLEFLDGLSFNYIDLSKNNLSDLKELSLDSYSVKLDDNNISELKISNSIGDLSLNNNKVSKISVEGNGDSLEQLSLSNNSLSSLDIIKPFSKLYSLKANGNNITSLKGIADTNIEYLYLDDNKISKIDETNKNLKLLSLKNNELESLDNITDFEELYYLDVNSNKISNFNDLDKLNDLNDIDIGNNKLNDLTEISKQLSSKESLFLSLEGTKDVTGKVGDNVYGLNLAKCSLKDVELKSNDLYALNINDINGDFDLYSFIENNENYYIMGNGITITNKEFDKYLETSYKLSDNNEHYSYDYTFDEDGNVLETNYVSRYVDLEGFNINYSLEKKDDLFDISSKTNIRRYLVNTYFESYGSLSFNDKFDGFKVIGDKGYFENYYGNKIKFVSE